jgi:hypothetical protein
VIVEQVAGETGAIGVVAEQRAILAQGQRVDRAGPARPRSELRRQMHGGFLVRHRDVQALAALGNETAHAGFELRGGGIQRGV